MKRLIPVFTFVWMMLTGACRVWGDAAPVRILPLGDSITLGCCSDVDIEGGYRTPLYNLLTNSGYTVDYLGTLQDSNNPALPDSNHEGHSGYRIDQIDAGVDTWLQQDGDPDVILLLIGVNDYWQNYNTATATNRLENLIIHLANQRPYAKILVANLLLRTDDPSYEAAQTPFNDAVPQIAARQTALGRQVYFVDLHSSCEPTDINDGVHPKQSGYLKVAQTWFPAITNVISPWGTTNPPAIARVMQADFQHVLITFSKPLEDAATNVANFSLNGGVSVLQAQLDPVSKRTITLSTTTQAQNTFYTVSVSGVRDRTPAHTPIVPGSTGGFASLTLANGSFEADYAGWLTNGNQTVASEAQFPTSNGSKVVVFNDGETTPNGVLSQTFTTIPGQAYVLKFDLGVISYNQNEQQLQLRMQGNSTLLLDTASLFGAGGGTVVWAAKSYSFVADSPTTTLTFHDVSPTTAGLDMLLDNVRVNPQNPRTLTVSSLPSAGLNIGVSPADNNGAQNGVTTFSRIYDSGTVVNLTAPATAGTTVFKKWQLNGLDFSTSPSASVSMDTDQTLTAIYGTAPPAITNQPLSLTARVGSTAIFSVMAYGQTPLTYQWRHSGTNIPGANSSSFTNSNVQTADAGNFDVVVSNAGGATISSAAVLTVITSGSLANGSFESGGAGWMESGNEVVVADSGFPTTDGVRVSVFNGGQTVPNGVIRQRFTTTPGQTYLLQLDMGVIAHNQDSQSLNVTVQGNNLLLFNTISAQGLGNGATRWTPLSYSFVADSTVTTLKLQDVSSNTLNIDLLVDNVRVYEQVPHTLTVSSTPLSGLPVTVSPSDTNAASNGVTGFSRQYNAGTVVSLAIPSNSGTTVFKKWQKNGTDFSTTPTTTLVVEGDETLNAVYITAPPTITNQPLSLTTTVNGTAVFTVAAIGVEPLSYQWRLNGTNLPGATQNSYTNSNVQASDAGNYDVIISNSGGTNFSSAAILTVLNSGLLANGSFESGYEGWTAGGNQDLVSAPGWPVTDGTNSLVFNGGQTTPDGLVWQRFTTVPGQTYALDFDFGVVAYNSDTQMLLVTAQGDSLLLSQTNSISGSGGGLSKWASVKYQFVANSTVTTLSFRDVSPATLNIDLLLDNVRVNTQTVWTLAIASSPANGLDMAVTPADNFGNSNGVTGFSRVYNDGTVISLTAPMTSGTNVFQKWQKDGLDFGTSATANVTADGSHTLTAVYVQPPPQITSQPADLTATVGNTALFDVGANGGGLSYQWRQNGTNIPGATSSTLSKMVVQSTDAGSYDVLVYNSTGTNVSRAAILTVITSGILANGSFEFFYQGWTTNGNQVVVQDPGFPTTDGTKVNVLNGGQSTPNATLQQRFTTTPGHLYALEFDMGVIAYNSDEQRLQVIVQGTSNLLSQTVSAFGLGGGATKWVPASYTFVADSQITTLTFQDISPATLNLDTLLDNVRVYPIGGQTLTVSSFPDAGVTVSVSPADTNGASDGATLFSRFYQSGAIVSLTAPTASGTNVFKKWQNDGVDFSTNLSTTVTLLADHNLTAVYGPAELTPATIVLSNLVQVYDGIAKSVTAITEPAGLGVQLSYDGSFDPPTNAGLYEVVGTIVDSNYSGTTTNTLVISPAPAIVTITNLAHVFDGNGQSVTAETEPAGLNVQLTYDGDSVPPTNAGLYQVVGTVIDPNYSGRATNTVVISPAPAIVTLTNLAHVFDGNGQSASAETEPVGLNVQLTYDGDSVPPTNAGLYEVVGTVINSNYFGSATNTLAINPAPLTVTANDETKLFGQVDPAFTATFNGFVGTDDSSALNGTLTFTREPGEAEGLYVITPSGLSATNYQVIFNSGTLTISPTPAPVILSLTNTGADQFVITWSAVSNVTYQVRYRSDLATGDWTPLTNLTATNETASATDNTAGAPQRFYQVIIPGQ